MFRSILSCHIDPSGSFSGKPDFTARCAGQSVFMIDQIIDTDLRQQHTRY
ncbi:MAG: hypothetical protein ACOYJR_07385 [Acutalibacteraceae bacterium]